uniref:Uncharacterized protein n=1 Tax=Clytia hemisphaerica TaxID=252671 RepID=A0A7M5XIM7_9CNID
MIECFKSARKKYNSWLDIWNNLPIFRKEVLIVLSIVIGTVNFGLSINDFVQFGELHRPCHSTYSITTELLASITIGFYFGLTGFVYSCIRQSKWKFVAIFAIAWNMFVLIFRTISEFVYVEFRPD